MKFKERVWSIRDWKLTGRGLSADTPYFGLHLTLTKVGDDTANFVIDKDICSLLVVVIFLERGRYDTVLP